MQPQIDALSLQILQENVLFRGELPCGPVSLGKYHSLVYGKLSYFICRYIIKSFMLGQPARNTGLSIPSRCSLLFYFFMRKKWLTIYLFMSIFNLEKKSFFSQILDLDLSQGLCPSPLVSSCTFASALKPVQLTSVTLKAFLTAHCSSC